MSENQSDSVKPWTIRGVPPEVRNAIIAAADRSDMTVGEWVSRMGLRQIQQEVQASRAPVPVGPVMSASPTDLSDIEPIIARVRDLAAAGVPISKRAAARAYNALLSRLPQNVAPRPIAAQADPPAIPRTEDRMT